MAYEIETGVEMPLPQRGSRYPWSLMKVGDSFFIEGKLKKLGIPSAWGGSRKYAQAIMEKNGAGSPMGLRVKRVA